MLTFSLGVVLFTLIVIALVSIIIAARSRLVSSGNVNITINGEKTISVPAGGKLLQTLAGQKLFVPSACGGGGTCAQCRVRVHSGGGSKGGCGSKQLRLKSQGPLRFSVMNAMASLAHQVVWWYFAAMPAWTRPLRWP